MFVPATIPRCPARGRRGRNGFSMIELLLVVVIILTIAAIAIPNLVSAITLAKVARAVGDINSISDDIVLYQSIYYVLPDSLAQCGDGNILDPWGNPYQYFNHATMTGNGQIRLDRFMVPLNSEYDLYTMGADGKTMAPISAQPSQDDIIRAGDGSYVGLASQF